MKRKKKATAHTGPIMAYGIQGNHIKRIEFKIYASLHIYSFYASRTVMKKTPATCICFSFFSFFRRAPIVASNSN